MAMAAKQSQTISQRAGGMRVRSWPGARGTVAIDMSSSRFCWRELRWGSGVAARMDVAEGLVGVSSATATTVLLKRGLRNTFLRRTRPFMAGQARVVGRAFTLRFVPAREDLATPESWASPTSTRAAIEAMPAGCVAVVDAAGVTDAGIFGDILCARMRRRGV